MRPQQPLHTASAPRAPCRFSPPRDRPTSFCVGCARAGDGESVALRIPPGYAWAYISIAMALRFASLVALVALALVPAAHAGGGRYSFDGGTRAEQAQVTAALDASSFDWSIVPGRVVVHIASNIVSSAAPNEIWLDARLLDSGRFSWGVVQHEYAHVVDFGVLNDAMRSRLAPLLGGTTWWGAVAEHDQLGSERFADLLAYAYWPSAANVAGPAAGAASFRATLSSLLHLRTLQRVSGPTARRR
jgi:hypothetical protein